MRRADGVKVAVYREGRTNLEFILAAAHAHVRPKPGLEEVSIFPTG